jgi:hypothetical protein
MGEGSMCRIMYKGSQEMNSMVENGSLETKGG